MSEDTQRREELATQLAVVRERIRSACSTAGRSPDDVTLIAVTKTYPASDVALLLGLGVTDIGENRDQEAGPKVAAVRAAGLHPVFHFVGQLQTNKAGSVARYADVVQSVDRPRLVTALDRAAGYAERRLAVLLQVDLDDDADARARSGAADGRGGVAPSGVTALADRVAGADRLTLAGVMAVAPLTGDPRPAFERLAGIAERVRTIEPAARWISAGMSSDLEAAVAVGATHVRVGTAILGSRTPRR